MNTMQVMVAARTVWREALAASIGTFAESVADTLGIQTRSRDYTLSNGLRLIHEPRSDDRKAIRECIINDYYTRFITDKHLETVVDLGAHKGYFAVGLFQKCSVGKMVCVEPLAENLEAIHHNLMGHRVNLEPCAVSTSNGEAVFYVAQNCVDSGFRDPSSFSAIKSKRRVPVCTLTSILQKHRIETIDLLKIDIEGSEYELFGSPLQFQAILRARQIVMEVHPRKTGKSASGLISMLTANGYEVLIPNPAFPELIFARRT